MATLIRGAIGIGVGGVDNMKINFGTGDPASLSWDTSDANANMLKLQLPAGGAVDVPVFWIGTSIYGVDMTVLNGATDPTFVVSSNTTPTTDYVTLSHNATSALLNVAGGSLALQIAGTTEALLDATNFSPGTNDGNALGVSGTAWADLFLASAGVINWNAGNMTLTHAAGKITVGGGTLNLAGNLVLDSALDIAVPANTAVAYELSDGTTKIHAADTQTGVSAVSSHTFRSVGVSLPNAASAWHRLISFNGYNATLAGTTQVTTAMNGMMLYVDNPSILQSGGAVTVDEASVVYVLPPIAGASVTLTKGAGIFVTNPAGSAGTFTNLIGIRIGGLDRGTNNFQLLMDNGGTEPTAALANTVALYSVDVAASTVLGLVAETAAAVSAGTASTHKIAFRYNNATYYWLVTNV